jgi:hypothetical protein
MFCWRPRDQERGTKFALKRRRHGRRVSAGTHAGISLVQKSMGTVGILGKAMKPIPYYFGWCDVSQFNDHSTSSSTANPYYENLKPFLLVMRAMGVLPLTSEAAGKHVGTSAYA